MKVGLSIQLNCRLTLNASIDFIQNHPPGTRLEESKNSPPGTIIVYKNPSLETTESQKPNPQDIKLENFTNISINSDTIWTEKLCGLNK